MSLYLLQTFSDETENNSSHYPKVSSVTQTTQTCTKYMHNTHPVVTMTYFRQAFNNTLYYHFVTSPVPCITTVWYHQYLYYCCVTSPIPCITTVISPIPCITAVWHHQYLVLPLCDTTNTLYYHCVTSPIPCITTVWHHQYLVLTCIKYYLVLCVSQHVLNIVHGRVSTKQLYNRATIIPIKNNYWILSNIISLLLFY